MTRRISALLLCLIYLTAAICCTACSNGRGTGAGYHFSYTLNGNPQTLDPQLATDAASKTIIGNLFAGLYRMDNNGAVTPDVARSCTVSEDGLTYTIALRQNSFWMDKSGAAKDESSGDTTVKAVTATDFAFAFYRMFDPEIHSPYPALFSCLKNATEIINGTASNDTLGVVATDPYTLVFKLAYPNASFLSLLATSAAMPCCASFYYDCNGRYGLDEESIISNGAFYLKQWFYDPYGKDNQILLKRNAENHKQETVFPTNLTFYIAKSQAEVEDNFFSKKSDCLLTDSPAYAEKTDNTVTAAASQTLGLIFMPQHPQLQNPKLRKAMALGLSRETYAAELTPDVTTACALIPPAISLLGRPYRELVAETSFLQENEAEAISLFQAAMQELGAKSLTASQLLVPAGLTDYTVLHSIVRRWSDLFGFYLSIEEIPMEEYRSRLESGTYAVALYALSANFANPTSVLEQFLTDPCLKPDDETTTELTTLMQQTKGLESLNASVELYRQAERIILEDNVFMPLFYKNRYLVCRKGNEDIRIDPFTEQVFFQKAKYFE